MGGGAVIVAIAAARKREMEKVLDAYRVAGATHIDQARSLYELGIGPNTLVDELREAGVLKHGHAPDSWYLDERAYVELRDTRFGRQHRRTKIITVIMILLAFAGLLVALKVNGIDVI
jgi:hypothetical protein